MIGSVVLIGLIRHRRKHAEVQHDHDGDEDPQEKQELALREEVRFAGLVNQLGNFAHRAVHRQVFQTAINGQSEDQSEDAKQNPERQQLVPVDPKERDLREVGKFQARLASGVFLSRGGRSAQARSAAALTAPAFANRLRSEPKPASQVRISDPPLKSCNQAKVLSC